MSHQTISFIKSGIRFIGYMVIFGLGDALVPFQPAFAVATRVAGIVLILSELVGVVEEIGHD